MDQSNSRLSTSFAEVFFILPKFRGGVVIGRAGRNQILFNARAVRGPFYVAANLRNEIES